MSNLSSTPKNNRKAKDKKSKDKFTGAGLSPSKDSTPAPLYKWELDNQFERGPINIDGQVFIPSDQPSVYVQHSDLVSGGGESTLDNQFVDVHVILTEDEMKTLAARRKKLLMTATAGVDGLSSVNTSFNEVLKSHAAGMSVHSSIPYVDPKRIQKELFVRR